MKQEPIIIAMDNGKRNVKARCGNKELVFRNAYSKRASRMIGNDSKTWNVCYDGREYTIGDSGTLPVDTLEGKGSDIHIISTLTTITRFLNPEEVNNNIILVYGESLNLYFNRDNVTSIKNRLRGRHEITVDEQTYHFEIKEVEVLPEAIGVALENYASFKGINYIIDIGGKTINFLSLLDGRPVEEESTSVPFGIMSVETEIKELAKKNSKLGNLSDLVISEKLAKGTDNAELQKIIDEAIENCFMKLDTELGKKDIYIHDLIKLHGATFIGGGSELFKNQIYNYYTNKVRIANDALRANVNGFYAYGEAKYKVEE